MGNTAYKRGSLDPVRLMNPWVMGDSGGGTYPQVTTGDTVTEAVTRMV